MLNIFKKLIPALAIFMMLFTMACRKAILAPSRPSKAVLLDLVNNYRKASCTCGTVYYPPVNPVVWNDTLELAAKDHSDDMDTKQYFSHTGSDGSNTGDRLSKYNYLFTTYGENIAEGYANEQDVMLGWIKSTGHCQNIMDGDFKEMGVATKGKYWTQVFAAH
ncbi:CAP domain-containing protein [Mucilaginibacter sp. FT3.2]|uniref:CAP domain-containing protein n=1 Tax=Mucilaginibacter sp. FT3.2 TaxID=2723090 RepID=UPI001612F22E|nr:CAP domain-containing protein [Mucilaginibacter sp. FT3.2]MBB6231950.1 uncharacterized protein YkwD [Mucilaginibacter sp. FT3.2]